MKKKKKKIWMMIKNNRREKGNSKGVGLLFLCMSETDPIVIPDHHLYHPTPC